MTAKADQFAFVLSSSPRVVKVIRYLMIQGIEGVSPFVGSQSPGSRGEPLSA